VLKKNTLASAIEFHYRDKKSRVKGERLAGRLKTGVGYSKKVSKKAVQAVVKNSQQ
jgi:hypothetical protein